jgi:hypothetical protein
MRWLFELIRRILEWLGGKGDQGNRILDADEQPRDEVPLRDDPNVISPPFFEQPIYQCASAVIVRGFIPHAEIEIEIDGVSVLQQVAGFPEPDGQLFPLPNPLVANQVLRVRQRSGGATSAWSTPIVAGDHTADYPAGPPRPTIDPAPVFECGARTGVSNLLAGCNVWITADGTEAGRVNGAKEHQGVNVNPDYQLNQHVRAWAELCNDPSPPSQDFIAGPAPTPLPTPTFAAVYESGEQIRIESLVNGARFTLIRGGVSIGPIRTWGHSHLVALSPPFAAGETISATQEMCPGDPPSGSGTTTVQPCANLPAPVVAPVQHGDTFIHLLQWVAGAQIKVFANSTKIGDGGGSPIALIRPVQGGETLYVYQVVGTCRGSTVRVVTPRCIAPPTGTSPAALDLFPVGEMDYAVGNVKGSVFYPAEDDGSGQPFNRRWANVRRSPLVVMAHGNHATHHHPDDRRDEVCAPPAGWPEIPNHKGYRYFQRQLARMGIVAVSVDCNATNCEYNTMANIEQRAELIMASIAHFQALDSGGDPVFANKIDFQAVGMLGHSRGGEAVVIAGNQAPGQLGVNVGAVISLAPVNHDAFTPTGYPFMTILPASDGDVSDNGGARFYDIARPEPLKSQIYIDFANHNYFNREWVEDEDGRTPPAILARGDHERILAGYGCALFRGFLLGHSTLDYLTYRVHPPGFNADNVHLSFQWDGELTVDDHEQPNGIARNSLDRPTSQAAGMSADEFELWQFAPNAYSSNTFYGHSVGMVLTSRDGGVFHSELDREYDLGGSEEVWLRVAEVSGGGPNPAGQVVLDVGLEDRAGNRAWLGVAEVGGVPRPFDHAPGQTKTMLTTRRFPAACFGAEKEGFDRRAVRALLLRYRQPDQRAVAFDVLQIVAR